MRMLKTSVLALGLAAFATPALACGGMKSKQSAQTTVTETGPQTTVKQTASTTKK